MKPSCFSTEKPSNLRLPELFGRPAPRRAATDRILHPRIDPCVSLVVGIAAQARIHDARPIGGNLAMRSEH